MPKIKTTGTEAQEQAALITWANLESRRHPELELLLAIPNGEKRDKATAGKLKAQGVKPGVPDLLLPVKRGEWVGLWIEMKVTRGRISDAQRWWHTRLIDQRYLVISCWDGWKPTSQAILAYLAGKL